MKSDISEFHIACELVRLLDGLPIEQAQQALARAQTLLLTTQTVRGDSPLLAVLDENDAALKL